MGATAKHAYGILVYLVSQRSRWLRCTFNSSSDPFAITISMRWDVPIGTKSGCVRWVVLWLLLDVLNRKRYTRRKLYIFLCR